MSAARRVRFGIPLLILYGVALALIAFWPVPVDREMTGLLRALARAVPLLSYDVVEFGANVLLFVPLGILLALAMPRHRPLVVPVALVVTGAIEAGQALFLDERTASLRDVLANTLGAAAGLLIVVIAERNSSRAVAVPDSAPRRDDGDGVERRW
ncbi:VanZ family protein [Microbacterium sp. ProA8]|uniref:VanZ family protein n=1 Tax=Microbacterium chionoecetis TaxID=3153754 RepID=UPI003262E4B1